MPLPGFRPAFPAGARSDRAALLSATALACGTLSFALSLSGSGSGRSALRIRRAPRPIVTCSGWEPGSLVAPADTDLTVNVLAGAGMAGGVVFDGNTATKTLDNAGDLGGNGLRAAGSSGTIDIRNANAGYGGFQISGNRHQQPRQHRRRQRRDVEHRRRRQSVDNAATFNGTLTLTAHGEQRAGQSRQRPARHRRHERRRDQHPRQRRQPRRCHADRRRSEHPLHPAGRDRQRRRCGWSATASTASRTKSEIRNALAFEGSGRNWIVNYAGAAIDGPITVTGDGLNGAWNAGHLANGYASTGTGARLLRQYRHDHHRRVPRRRQRPLRDDRREHDEPGAARGRRRRGLLLRRQHRERRRGRCRRRHRLLDGRHARPSADGAGRRPRDARRAHAGRAAPGAARRRYRRGRPALLDRHDRHLGLPDHQLGAVRARRRVGPDHGRHARPRRQRERHRADSSSTRPAPSSRAAATTRWCRRTARSLPVENAGTIDLTNGGGLPQDDFRIRGDYIGAARPRCASTPSSATRPRRPTAW